MRAHFERMFSIIDGNRTNPGGEPRPICSLTPSGSTLVPSSNMSTPVRNVAVDLCGCVPPARWQPFLALGGSSSPVLHPVSDRLRKASTMSRFRQVCNGPSSNVGHFLRDSSMSTFFITHEGHGISSIEELVGTRFFRQCTIFSCHLPRAAVIFFSSPDSGLGTEMSGK